MSPAGRITRPPAAPLALLLLAALVLTLVAAVRLGSVHLPWQEVIAVITRRLGMPTAAVSLLEDQIVWQLRLPRVIGAAATGAGLAVCGVVLQSLTRNDLADPYLLGVSSGASVGAVSVLVLGVSVAALGGTAMLTLGAFAGAIASLLAVLLLATSRSGALPTTRTILAGVAVGQACTAYTAFVVILSGQPDAARRVLSWTLGSFAGVRWTQASVLCLAAVLALLLTGWYARDLDALAFGETAAGALGVSPGRMRWVLLTGTALVTACLVAYAGVIGFIGLVVPHVVRLLAGPGHRRLLPLSALGGAILLVWADVLARIVMPGQEIPVGVITAAVGARAFAMLLRRQGYRE